VAASSAGAGEAAGGLFVYEVTPAGGFRLVASASGRRL
jgi:hypothetical protein